MAINTIIKQQPRTLCMALALGLTVSLAACGDGDNQAQAGAKGGGASSSPNAQKALDEVQEQHARLTIEGSVQNADDPTAQPSGQPLEQGDHVYRPAQGTGNAEYIRKGSNDEGPYSVVVYTEAVHDKEPDEAVRTFMTINFPENAQPGTYQLAAHRDAADDEGQARITGAGYGWIYGSNVEGTVDIQELGDELTAAWDFTASDRQGNDVQVSGAVKDLPFSPQHELFYELDIDGEQTANRIRPGYGKKDSGLSLFGGKPTFYVTVPLDLEPGDYPVGKLKDGNIDINIPDLSFDEASGEVSITENGEHYRDIHFEFTTAGENVVKASGDYRYIPVDLLQSQ